MQKEVDGTQRGLTTEEAARRFAQFGPNEPAPAQRGSGAAQLLLLLANPLVIILLIASIVSALVGQSVSAVIIVCIVAVGVAIDFVQTYRSQQAIERLREKVTPTATVLRDGAWGETQRRALVPGDVIRLSAGDLVPADSCLIQARDLHVQEAALTGESMPVEKEPVPPECADFTTAQPHHAVFIGTSVVSGTATAVVVKTGSATVFGEIASHLAARPPETQFEAGTRRFGFLILRTTVFLVLLVFLVNLWLHRDPLESLLFSVALAVGLTPEFLPMIISVTLARGAVHMAQQKVVVKHLAAMQNLGSMDILCSDKTGTLTSGSMILDRAVDPLGQPSDKVRLFAYLNSFHETGIKSPLDAAILRGPRPTIEGYEKLDEIPFDFERRRLSIVVAQNTQRWLIAKGAPEGVLACCTSYEQQGEPRPLDDAARERCQATYRQLSEQGFRVLAVGIRAVPTQIAYRAADETDLVLLGYMVFLDPPLEGAADALLALRRDGVRTKILTGDNELVARHVCGLVGLDASRVVLGDELARMSDTALGHVAEQAGIFARVSPAQKNRVILALKRRSHVVGYLGDGINDAPSLHAADVGISVASAVDVAKDAADIILLEGSLGVLHSGILEGRRAFGNVMKYLLMGTSSNFGNMLSMAVASFFLPFLPMLPMQILLNNFLYDLSQLTIPTDRVDRSLTFKPRRWDIRLIRNFMLCLGPISSLFDTLTFIVLLKLFHASESLFHTGWFVESLATQTLVIFVIRTAGNPLRSKPSLPLAASVVAVVLIAVVLPFTPLADMLGFSPLPAGYLLFLVGVTVAYLLLVEVVKRQLMGRWMSSDDTADDALTPKPGTPSAA